MLSYAYRLLTDLGAPAIALYLRRRRRRGKEDPARFQERLGHAAVPRPPGPLIWCHGASVGEALSLLTLIEALRSAYPAINILCYQRHCHLGQDDRGARAAGRDPSICAGRPPSLCTAISRSLAARPGVVDRIRPVAEHPQRGQGADDTGGAVERPDVGAVLP